MLSELHIPFAVGESGSLPENLAGKYDLVIAPDGAPKELEPFVQQGGRLLAAGVALGAALGAKFSCVVLVPLVLGILISYALDLDTEVAPETKGHPEELLSVKLAKGTMIAARKHVRGTEYTVKNSGKAVEKVSMRDLKEKALLAVLLGNARVLPDVRGWRPVAKLVPEVSPTVDLGRNLAAWLLGCAMVYLALFGIGRFVLLLSQDHFDRRERCCPDGGKRFGGSRHVYRSEKWIDVTGCSCRDGLGATRTRR